MISKRRKALHRDGADVQAQSLPTYRVEVRKRYEGIVVEVFALGSFKNFLAKLFLDVGVLCKKRQRHGKGVRRGIHGGEEDGPATPQLHQFTQRGIGSEKTHEICPMSSTSGNLSCSTAFIFARTAARLSMRYSLVAAAMPDELTENAHEIFALAHLASHNLVALL